MRREAEIYNLYEKLIHYAAWRYSSRYEYLDHDELVSIGNLVFMEYIQEARETNGRFPHSKFKCALWWSMLGSRNREGLIDYGKRIADKFVNIDEIMAVDSETYNDLIFKTDLKNLRRLVGLEENILIDCVLGINRGIDVFLDARVKRQMRLNYHGVINSFPRKKRHDPIMDDLCQYMNLSSTKIKMLFEVIKERFGDYLLKKDEIVI